MRGFNYNDLTGSSLVFWNSACFREVVARGSSTVIIGLEFGKVAEGGNAGEPGEKKPSEQE